MKSTQQGYVEFEDEGTDIDKEVAQHWEEKVP